MPKHSYEMTSRVNLSGVKTVPQSDLRVGTTLDTTPKCLKILQWNAGGLTQAKWIELSNNLEKHKVDIFMIQEANIAEEQIKYYKSQLCTMQVQRTYEL